MLNAGTVAETETLARGSELQFEAVCRCEALIPLLRTLLFTAHVDHSPVLLENS